MKIRKRKMVLAKNIDNFMPKLLKVDMKTGQHELHSNPAYTLQLKSTHTYIYTHIQAQA